MTDVETKSETYARQSRDAHREMLMGPRWIRRNANDPERRFRDTSRTDIEHLKDAMEIVLDVARQYKPAGKGPHTPYGHDCAVCEAMLVLVDWLAE